MELCLARWRLEFWGFIMCGIFVGIQAAQRPNRILLILAYSVPVWLSAGFLFGVLT